MTAITAAANNAVRDFVTPGVPASGDHEPLKSEVRAVFAVIDAALSSLGVNGAITVKKATRALLDADLAHAADVLAVVYNDSTPANNGIYAKAGGSGSGSWAITALALPSSFAVDLAEALAAQEAASSAAVAAAAAADAASDSEAAAASSVTAAAAAVTDAAAQAAAAQSAAQSAAVTGAAQVTAAAAWSAQAAASAATAAALAGVERIFNTKALADAGLGSVTANAHIIVQVDESRGGLKSLYQKVSGAYVFVDGLNSISNPTVEGDLTLTGALVVPDDQAVRIGTNAMPSLGTAGTYNYPGASIAIGLNAGFSNVEGGVIAIGWEAGYYAGQVGDESAITAVGWKALKHTTTGHATAFGWAAGQFNTTGHIAAFGDEAAGLNTTGQMAALGYYAGCGNETGDVTAVGYRAGRAMGPNTLSTLVGHEAGVFTIAANLTAVGYKAASGAAISGAGNSVFGHFAFFSGTTGGNNTVFGVRSLFDTTTGFDNTAAGADAGRSIVDGYYNTFLGSEAGFNALQKADAINSMALGRGAYTTYDNSVVIGNLAVTRVTTYGNFGPNGKVDPAFPLDVRGNAFPGIVANFRNDDGFGFALQINDVSDTLGYGASYRHAIYWTAGESLALVEDGSRRMVIAATTGWVGIATDAPEYALDVAGPIGFTPGSSVTPAQNGDVVFELTSNTSLTVKAKGSDGTVRTHALALAA